MGLFVGHHPSLHSVKAGVSDVVRHPGRVGHVPVEWLRWSEDGRYFSEALVEQFFAQSVSRSEAALVLHIFAGAQSEEEVAEIERASAALRLEQNR
jgi:hypothetical protein